MPRVQRWRKAMLRLRSLLLLKKRGKAPEHDLRVLLFKHAAEAHASTFALLRPVRDAGLDEVTVRMLATRIQAGEDVHGPEHYELVLGDPLPLIDRVEGIVDTLIDRMADLPAKPAADVEIEPTNPTKRQAEQADRQLRLRAKLAIPKWSKLKREAQALDLGVDVSTLRADLRDLKRPT